MYVGKSILLNESTKETFSFALNSDSVFVNSFIHFEFYFSHQKRVLFVIKNIIEFILFKIKRFLTQFNIKL